MKKKRAMLSAAVLGLSASAMAGIVGYDDITYWVGSGANEAALVLDFHDGYTYESFAWGYRWDGTASGADMLMDIVAADANLSASYFGDGDSGFYLSSVSYHDGAEAHFSSSWGYYVDGGFAGEDIFGDPAVVAGGGDTLPASWTSSPSGASLDSYGTSGRILTDGAWDAWGSGSWVETSPDVWEFDGAPGSEVQAAIPEPSSVLLMAVGFGGLLWFRRRRKYLFRG